MIEVAEPGNWQRDRKEPVVFIPKPGYKAHKVYTQGFHAWASCGSVVPGRTVKVADRSELPDDRELCQHHNVLEGIIMSNIVPANPDFPLYRPRVGCSNPSVFDPLFQPLNQRVGMKKGKKARGVPTLPTLPTHFWQRGTFSGPPFAQTPRVRCKGWNGGVVA